MAYLGLARKWRPQVFGDLVGQEHIARTIQNAIRKERIGQGYLFTGTRGIGKTSAARIFAKALRCTKPVDAGVPCGKCKDCVEIAEGRSVDVLEIDGASNNGVDAVREIREATKYLPSSGKYKIYIIDEVHMLTTAAFNALLKTLEEPPPHVIFVFATTDPQKIPETVLSRTQRFDFKRVPLKALQERIHEICDAEKIKISADALALLAREAEGSMRDAVSLLDQVISVAGAKEISGEELSNALGLVDKKTVLDCVTGILTHQPLMALEAAGRIHLHGFDLKQFGREVLRMVRTVMLAKLLEQNKSEVSQYLDLSDVDVTDVKGLTGARSLDDLDMLFRLLSHGLEDVARSQVPKMVLDVLIIKMASSAELVQLSQFGAPAGGSSGQQTARPQPVAAPVAAPAPMRASAQPEPTVRTPETKVTQQDSKSSIAPFDWKAVVAGVKQSKPLFGSNLDHLGFAGTAIEGDTLVITLTYTKENSFFAEQLKVTANRDALNATLSTQLGRAARLDYKEAVSNNHSIAQAEEHEKRAQVEERKKKILESEAFKATQQLLGAKLEKLELKGD